MPTKTIQDSLENVEAYEINNFDDLYIPMLEAKEIFKDALNSKEFKFEVNFFCYQSRHS